MTPITFKTSHLLILPYCLAIFYSCAPAYVPNKVNTGLFSEKGEIHAEIAVGDQGVDIQGAAALSDHVLVTANGSFRNSTFESSSNSFETSSTKTGRRRHQIFEVGTGYYHTWSSGLTVEAVFGYGHGQVKKAKLGFSTPETPGVNLLDPESGLADATFNKYFFQPSIGITSKYVDFAYSNKVASLNLRQANKRFDNLVWEPAMTARFGAERVKFTGQIGLSIHLEEAIEYTHDSFFLSVGVLFELGKRKD